MPSQPHTRTLLHMHIAVMGYVIGKLKTTEPPRIPFGVATCQVLDWNIDRCSLYLKHSQKRHWSRSQAFRSTSTDGHLSPQTPTTAHPLQANSRTWSHAQSSLAKFTFHFSTISSRDEWSEWYLLVKHRVLASNHSPQLKLILILMARVNGTGLSLMAISYLLWGREAAPHWLGWTSTSWRTPPPRPRHLHFRSTGREEGHRPKRKGSGEGHTECSVSAVKCDSAAKEEISGLVQWATCFLLTVSKTTRWHWSKLFVKVLVFTSK